MVEEIIPDTSVLVDGTISSDVESGHLDNDAVLVPEIAVDELENQANEGLSSGYAGIEEIKKLNELSGEGAFDLDFVGDRPSPEQVELAEDGRLDALIREIAEARGACLYTSDRVQAEVAEARGVDVRLVEKDEEEDLNPVEEFFTEDTMSVHIKQGAVPKAKRGEPGEMSLEPIEDSPITRSRASRISQEIIEAAEAMDNGLVEMEQEGATVVQIGSYRIAVSRPPFSEAVEITAVRPVADVDLSDYDLSDGLMDRLDEEADGILIAGAPGHGKSTFAQALATYYEESGEIMKTMEKPRDLDVGPDITQYSGLEGRMEDTGDFLLLVRPDYTVYDEVRKTEDFEVYSDMRMAGVGMIGVVHATEPIDAVQRLIGRVELGMIPQVCDTVIGIRDAEVDKVFRLELTVKIPEGMNEADLARPVVLVSDLSSGDVEYEIYTYGEQTVVVPSDSAGGSSSSSRMEELASRQLMHLLESEVSDPEVEFLDEDHIELRVRESDIPRVIGNNGENIDRLEEDLGLSITVEEKAGEGGSYTSSDASVDFTMNQGQDAVVFDVGDRHSGENLRIEANGNTLMHATVGQNGMIRISKGHDKARILSSTDASHIELVK